MSKSYAWDSYGLYNGVTTCYEAACKASNGILTNMFCKCAGTKGSAARYVGNGLGVVSVNPYGCNAPATPLQTWNIDLNGLYSVSGIVMNAIAIPSQGGSAILDMSVHTAYSATCVQPFNYHAAGRSRYGVTEALHIVHDMYPLCRRRSSDQSSKDGGRHINMDRQQPGVRSSEPYNGQSGEDDKVLPDDAGALSHSHRHQLGRGWASHMFVRRHSDHACASQSGCSTRSRGVRYSSDSNVQA